MTYFILLTSIRSFDVTTVNPNKLSKKFHRGAHKTELHISKLFHPDNQEIFVVFFYQETPEEEKILFEWYYEPRRVRGPPIGNHWYKRSSSRRAAATAYLLKKL
jgi:hypothetical protein